MSDRAIILKTISLKTPNKFGANSLEVALFYQLDQMNYFTSREEPRGYFLGLQPMNKGGDGTYSYTMFSGKKYFVEPANRFSQKRLEQIAEERADDFDKAIKVFMFDNGLEQRSSGSASRKSKKKSAAKKKSSKR